MENDRFEYITNAFHELKNPLTTLTLACEILKSQCAGDKEKNIYLNMISRECIRMKNLIDNSIKSLKDNYFDIDINQDCDIHMIIQRVVGSTLKDNIGMYLMAAHHNVKGNVEYIESAFRELMENMKTGTSDMPLRLIINTFNKGNKIRICFSNNRAGIQQKETKGLSGEKNSTHVEINHVKRNMQRINGTVSVENKANRGVLFTITLPIVI